MHGPAFTLDDGHRPDGTEARERGYIAHRQARPSEQRTSKDRRADSQVVARGDSTAPSCASAPNEPVRSRSTAARRARSEQVERGQQVGSGKLVEVEHLRACVRKTRSVRCSSRVQGCSLAPPSALPRGPGERGTLHAHLCKKVSAALRPHLCGGRAKLSLSKEGCNPACPSLPLPSSRAGAAAVFLTSLCRRRRGG